MAFTALLVSPVNAELLVISYHEVSHELKSGDNFKAMSLKTSDLVAQFSWLKEHGYVSIDIDDLLAAQSGKRPLPPKAVLLSFDDGYRGMYEQVFPLLRAFNYSALIAVVGSWMETPFGKEVLYGNEAVARDYFLKWQQIRKMVQSGYVEVASHSYDLHHGVISNPQGNTQPAATSRRYDSKNGTYETDSQYRQRIYSDLKRNSDLIERKTGKRPRVMVWPYGAYNNVTVEIARSLGMPVTMSLKDNKLDINNLGHIGRLLIGHGTDLTDFIWQVNNHIKPEPKPIRVVHLDLDYLYDPDPAQQEKNLSLLLDRIKSLEINTVYLQAYADPDGDGTADALYFPNRHLPMRADLFNRVSWQLYTRSNVNVYAWLPVLAFDLPADHPLAKARVTASPPRLPGAEDYRRLSPFNQQALEFVGDIYEDLAKHAHLDGLIFHDDAYLNDYEDASKWALDHYSDNWNLPPDISAIRNDPALFERWTLYKTKALAKWTDTLTERARLYRPAIKTARNMYAAVIMNPQSKAWFSQSLDIFLKHYDYAAVMAMPYMEKAKDPEKWLESLVTRIAQTPNALDKTVFELQSFDWLTQKPVDGGILARQMRILLQNGARNFGYYPDDFIQGKPQIKIIKPAISVAATIKEE